MRDVGCGPWLGLSIWSFVRYTIIIVVVIVVVIIIFIDLNDVTIHRRQYNDTICEQDTPGSYEHWQ